MHFNKTKTTKIQTRIIAESLGLHINNIKKVISRLKIKKALKTIDKKEGRGGWAKYKIEKKIVKILNEKSRKGHSLIYNNSNKDYYYKKPEEFLKQETVTKTLTNQLSNEWEEIDILPLEHIGFKKTHLDKLSQVENLTPEIVQDSINQFAWGLKYNSSNYEKYNNKLYVLIGTLKKGQPWIESSYESEEEKAIKEMILVQKQKQKEQDKLINELVDLEFPNWKSNLTQSEINEISPKSMNLSVDVTDRLLKTHFKTEIIIPRLNSSKKEK
jgi:hypothetical protein